MSKPLTPKQERFAELYVAGKSLTDSYIESHQSKANRLTAGKEASLLARRPKMAAHIAAIRAQVEQKVQEKVTAIIVEKRDAAVDAIAIDKAWVLEKLVSVVEKDKQDRCKALELIGKEFGMFIDRKMNVPADPLDGMTTAELRELLKAVDADSQPTGDRPRGTTH